MADRAFKIMQQRPGQPEVQVAVGTADVTDVLTFTEVMPGLGKVPADPIPLADYQAHLVTASESSGWRHELVWE